MSLRLFRMMGSFQVVIHSSPQIYFLYYSKVVTTLLELDRWCSHSKYANDTRMSFAEQMILHFISYCQAPCLNLNPLFFSFQPSS
jgi:ABC-type antimicrobial peptide transport system permease subunit